MQLLTYCKLCIFARYASFCRPGQHSCEPGMRITHRRAMSKQNLSPLGTSEHDSVCILHRCKKRCTFHPPYPHPTRLPLAQMVTLGDNDLFYFGGKPGWKHMQEADRQWQVLYSQCLACSCAGLMWTLSIKDRQCVWVQGRNPALAAAAFEHKWSMINLNSHMAVHVTVIATVLVFFKNYFALDGFARMWLPRHSNIHWKRNNTRGNLK